MDVYKRVVKDYELNGIAEAIMQQESAVNDTTAGRRVYNRMARAVSDWSAINHLVNRLEVDLGPYGPFDPPCAFRF